MAIARRVGQLIIEGEDAAPRGFSTARHSGTLSLCTLCHVPNSIVLVQAYPREPRRRSFTLIPRVVGILISKVQDRVCVVKRARKIKCSHRYLSLTPSYHRQARGRNCMDSRRRIRRPWSCRGSWGDRKFSELRPGMAKTLD